MEPRLVVRENWLSQKPRYNGWKMMTVFGLMLYATNIAFFNGLFAWLPASGKLVFADKMYWHAWSALFAHADLGHFMSNMFLFLPLTYLLTSYYGYLFFPIAGLFFGGLTNLIVLSQMRPEINLLGISGVVYWMGAAWLTLFVIVDRRSTWRKRLGVAACLTVILFIPETYKPEVSYLSHFVGFVLGSICGVIYYFVRRNEIEAAEVKEMVLDEDLQITA